MKDLLQDSGCKNGHDSSNVLARIELSIWYCEHNVLMMKIIGEDIW